MPGSASALNLDQQIRLREATLATLLKVETDSIRVWMLRTFNWKILLVCALAVPIAAQGADPAPRLTADNLPFQVISRMNRLDFFPCGECHDDLEPDPTPRELSEAPHFATLQHGQADIWCTTCHSLQAREYLHTLTGKRVEFDRAYLVCAQCHSDAYADWKYGAHGKRVRNWRGGREVLNCTACHDPHKDPGIEPRPPQPPPGVRADLPRQQRRRHHGGGRWGWEPLPEPGTESQSDESQR